MYYYKSKLQNKFLIQLAIVLTANLIVKKKNRIEKYEETGVINML